MLTAVEVVGLFLRPTLYAVWVFLVVFGIATLPRIALSKLRELRLTRRSR